MPLHEGLRIIYKGIGQRISANVTHGQRLPFSLQKKVDAARQPLDRARRDAAPDAHALAEGGPGQSRQLGDGVIVGLTLPRAEPTEPRQ